MPQRSRPFFRALLGLFAFLFVLVACSTEADIGEDCDEDGKTEGTCVSGAVCSKDKAGALKCLKLCSEQPTCGTNETCNGVSGSGLKACRPN